MDDQTLGCSAGASSVLSPQPDNDDDPAAAAARGPALGEVRIFGHAVDGLRRLGQQAAVRDPSKVSDVRMRLMRAGFFNRDAAIFYLGAKAAALAVATVGTIVLLPFALKGGGMAPAALAGVFAVAALLGPDQVLKSRQKSRELEYADGFPDLLDLLVASVEAGLSLDAAVAKQAQAAIKLGDFALKAGQALVLTQADGIKAARLVLAASGKTTLAAARAALAAALAQVKSRGVASAAVAFAGFDAGLTEALAEQTAVAGADAVYV